MNTRAVLAAAAMCMLGALACNEKATTPLFEKVSVSRRTIVVTASAAGVIEPVRIVDVKSKASGEIIQLTVETGSNVTTGQLLAVVDPRQPQNTLAQAEADLDVAQAQLDIASTKLNRAESLFKTRAITESEYEDARLSYVSANSNVVRARTDLENARDQMDDTRILASSNGTIITKNVEMGTVISSPTRDVGGGTVLFTMANLDTVQIRTRVDETDIGKIHPGMPATISVDAYPNRPFYGAVLKIEPQATVEQNVTMFPALVRIANPGHLLMPGMNAEVEIHIGRGEDVLAIPYGALRTPQDVASAAFVLGLDEAAVTAELENARRPAPGDSARPAPDATRAGGRPRERPADAGGTPRGGRGGARGGGTRSYIVFVLEDGVPTPRFVTTGLTDLDYIEVTGGVSEQDTVVVLPSASLVDSQQRMRERIERMTGGGGIPGMQNQNTQTTPVRR